MTLIASWGGPDSESYVTLSDANSIVESICHTKDIQAWTACDSMTRERALRKATQDIESCPWTGSRLYHDQRLKFPTSLENTYPLRYSNISSFSIDLQRQELKLPEACTLQAIALVKQQSVSAIDFQELARQGVTSYSASGGGTSQSFGLSKASSVLSREAFQILLEWKGYPTLERG